jgi:hypothetical protein
MGGVRSQESEGLIFVPLGHENRFAFWLQSSSFVTTAGRVPASPELREVGSSLDWRYQVGTWQRVLTIPSWYFVS